MRTTVDLPKKLLEEARELAGTPTMKDTIIRGLEELIRFARVEHLISLRGKLKLRPHLYSSRHSRHRNFHR